VKSASYSTRQLIDYFGVFPRSWLHWYCTDKKQKKQHRCSRNCCCCAGDSDVGGRRQCRTMSPIFRWQWTERQ